MSSCSKLPDIIAIQETWFSEELLQLYKIPGYASIHCCRDDKYGGTSLYIRENLQFSLDICKSECFVEIIAITLQNYKIDNRKLKIVSFYRSQKCCVSNFMNMMDVLLSNNAQNPIIVLGDSNVDYFRNPNFVDILNLFQNFDCDNGHDLVTRPGSGSSIDQVFSNFAESLYIDSIECELSDHNMISCKFSSRNYSKEHVEVSRVYYDYEKAKEVLKTSLPENYGLLNASRLTEKLIHSMERAIIDSKTEKKARKLMRFELTPWVSRNLQNLIIFKEKLLRERRRLGRRKRIEDALKRISKIVRYANRKCREEYYRENLSRFGNDPKKCWTFINNVIGRSGTDRVSLNDSEGNVMSDETMAESFNRYFLTAVSDLKGQILVCPNDNINSLRTLSAVMNVFKLDDVTLEDIINVILSMDVNKGTGYDNISPKFVKQCAEEIAPVLVEIFNKMKSSSEYPDVLKMHKVVPIPKEPRASSLDKYRPITILSAVDKIFERILFEKLSSYLETNKLLYDFQFGFRKGCGTADAVLSVVQYICKGLDDGFKGVAGIFFDFTKAFDLVDHGVMVKKLEFYGVRGNELLLFRSYFSNRRQYVKLNTARSFIGDVKYGVPQGSGLGPLLFSIYLNDLKNLGLAGKLYMFADDVCLFYPYKSDTVLRALMERDSALIFEFARLNGLLLNPSKIKVIRFRPHSQARNGDFCLYVDGRLINESHCVRYLGITLQSSLAWDMHISDIKRKIAPAIGILFKLRHKLSLKTKLMLYQTLIQTHLNYLAIVYACNKNSSSLKSLQRMQNRALKCIYNLPLTYSTLALYKDIAKTIFPVFGLHEYQLLIYVYKSLNGIGHRVISFSQNQSILNTRSRQNLRMPRCRLERTKQRIDFAGCVLYNDLPSTMKNIPNISVFKSACKKYLFESLETLLI
ncbi:uncharacterized protein LOC142235881 [Haematobia irritans]|uniref:uncharacterized protein LOC142235881 n=1 Tax=Haematobia irritans TaxID=7368 RepID=UPI003F50210A